MPAWTPPEPPAKMELKDVMAFANLMSDEDLAKVMDNLQEREKKAEEDFDKDQEDPADQPTQPLNRNSGDAMMPLDDLDNKHKEEPQPQREVIDLSQEPDEPVDPRSPQEVEVLLDAADKEADQQRPSWRQHQVQLVPNDPDETVQLQPGSTLVASRATLNAIAGAHYSPMPSPHRVKWQPVPREVLQKWKEREWMGKKIAAELEESTAGPVVIKMSASKETRAEYNHLMKLYEKQKTDNGPKLAQAVNLQRQILRTAELRDEQQQQRSRSQPAAGVKKRLSFTSCVDDD